MRRETRRVDRAVPATLGSAPVPVGQYRLLGDEFLLRQEGFACHYRRGEGLAVQLDDPALCDELELYIHGTVHAAIAAFNGLYALHASAVVVQEQVIAFSAPSGGGKSTLAAALDVRGHPLYCDDTLVIDPIGTGGPHDRPLCLPGHKRLKLWEEGLALAGVKGLGQVSPSYPKQFAANKGGKVDRMLPLGALVFMTDGDNLALDPVNGGERMQLLADDHYTHVLHEQAAGLGRAARFTFQAGLARVIPVYRLTRPFDPDRFADMMDFIDRKLIQLACNP